ncbi:hypothetical protein D3OALGA1CA_2779 [Olavius algarvensis associated proteobacterium Delta 3]|nr:hypothetical protein D3OALGB2SA_798 [Olavius algarvensis associated proteobacterium Delta 3]CAB5124153.1 hypothetical protein D3OALGA1CA_2779 [Olavius algarvensis associated proteobacterium Delta 3]
MLEIEQCVNNRIVALLLMYSSDTLFACEMNKRPVYKKIRITTHCFDDWFRAFCRRANGHTLRLASLAQDKRADGLTGKLLHVF